MTWWLLGAAAVLLSVERLTYIWICRDPSTLAAWSTGPAGTAIGGPIEVVRLLFIGFKVLQACVFVAWFVGHGGGMPLPPDAGAGAIAAGCLLVAIGQVLTLTAFYRLRRDGVFYGNRFGEAVPWCRQFPYSLLSHPQYVGAVVSIWGLFLVMRFPHPDWFLLPVLETIYYAAGAYLEG